MTIKKVVWDFSGTSNAEELHRRLQFSMFRRTKAEMAIELPPKTRIVIDVEVPRRNKFQISPALFTNKGLLRKALDIAADGAIKPVIEMIINEDLENESSCVVFTHRKLVAEHVVDVIAAAGYDCGFIHSGVSQKKREALLERARHAKGAFLIAATIDSTSTSIDLSFANAATVLELPYEWHVLAQAESRLHRYLQERPVVIRYPIARGTGAELVLQALLRKIVSVEAVVGPTGDSMREELDAAPKGQAALDDLADRIQKVIDEEAKAAKKKKAVL